MLKTRVSFGTLCVVGAALTVFGMTAQGDAPATWVARPAAASAVVWDVPGYAGRDFWMLLNMKWHDLPGIRDEAFVRESGVQYIRLPLIREGFSPLRQIDLCELEVCLQGSSGNISPQAKIAFTSDEAETQFIDTAMVNDGKPETYCTISGSPEDVKKRYTPVAVDIAVEFPSPASLAKVVLTFRDMASVGVSSLEFRSDDGREIKTLDLHFEGNRAVAEFAGAPAVSRLTICCRSRLPRVRMGEFAPELAERLSKVPFYPTCHFYLAQGGVLGYTAENIDRESFEAFFRKYEKTFMGFYLPEFDSNYFHLWKRTSSAIYPELMRYVTPETTREDAERNMRNIWNYQRDNLYLGNMFGLCGQLNFPQYGLEWGGNFSVMELAGNSPHFNHRNNLMFARGAARQYNKPWSMYLAYYAGSSTANSKRKGNTGGSSKWVDGLDYGIAPSMGRRLFYLCYYLGATFLDFESQPWGQVEEDEDGALSLTQNGLAMKDIFEWTRRPEGKRGTAYTPILFLMDYYHGHAEWKRGAEWKVWYFKPFEDGDYMAEHFLRAVDPYIPGAGFDKPPHSPNLHNSPLGDIFDVYFANAPSGAAQLAELGKYPVVIMLDDIAVTPELAANLRAYVRAGGTLLINSAQAGAFSEDEAFLGLKVQEGCTEVGGFQVRNTALRNARVELKTEDGLPLLTSNDYGRGRVLFTTPHFMLLKEKKEAAPLIEGILLELQADVLPIRIEGDIHFLLNKMDDGVWKLILMNNKGIIKLPTSSSESVDPAFTANVRIHAPPGTTAAEILVGADLSRDGDVFSLSIPPGQIRIVDLKGIEFQESDSGEELIGSESFGKSPGYVPRQAKTTKYEDVGEKAIGFGRKPEEKPNGGSGLMAEWKFDEGTGTVAGDSSGKGRDATIANAEYVKTKTGYALRFNGNDSHVGVRIKLQYPLKEGSYEAWAAPDLKPEVFWQEQDTRPRRGQIMHTGNILMHLIDGDKWGAMSYDGISVEKVTTPGASDGQWTHLVFTWENHIAKFYVNGKHVAPLLKYSGTIGNNQVDTTIALCLGAHLPGTYHNFNGLIDDFRLYGEALTPEEVRRKYEEGLRER